MLGLDTMQEHHRELLVPVLALSMSIHYRLVIDNGMGENER